MTTVWVLGDQLTLENAALAACDPRDTVVLLVESRSRGSFLRYHQHKLILIYAAMRHFHQALEAAGWKVDYHTPEDT